MPVFFAKSRRPPAVAIASTIVVAAVKGYAPGFPTCPKILNFLLRTCCTITVTSGAVMKFFSLSLISRSNCIGVFPAACISPASGSEIFPSERTGTDFVRFGSFQTLIANTSSLPITNFSSWGLSLAIEPDCGVEFASLFSLGADWAWTAWEPVNTTRIPRTNACRVFSFIATPVDLLRALNRVPAAWRFRVRLRAPKLTEKLKAFALLNRPPMRRNAGSPVVAPRPFPRRPRFAQLPEQHPAHLFQLLPTAPASLRKEPAYTSSFSASELLQHPRATLGPPARAHRNVGKGAAQP